jgi:hypothetical protein
VRGKLAFISLLLAALLSCLESSPANAQQCPAANQSGTTISSHARTLEGALVHHDGIRDWFELRLRKPTCGVKSLQLIAARDNWTPLETLRGCQVRSTGPIGFAGTGYYSLDLYQSAMRLQPIETCRRKAPFPDLSRVKPNRHVKSYTVHLRVNYGPGDHPIIFRVRSSGRDLRPWQAYARYQLTGSFVLYGFCADDFVIDKVFGTPAARPTHFDVPRTSEDRAAYDPETAATKGVRDLHLGYTCVRTRSAIQSNG